MNTKGGDIISLPITKKQFEDSLSDFIDEFKRLPYLPEDDVTVPIKNDKGEFEPKPYRARRYIAEYYGDQDNMTQELFDKGVISYKSIADALGLTETLVRNAMTKETKTPQIEVRRGLHMFFNKDLYKKELGDYNSRCAESCSGMCKQYYFSDTTLCSRYKRK